MNEFRRSTPWDYRRSAAGLLAVVLLVAWAYLKVTGRDGGSTKFLVGSLGRIGLLLAALCLAWTSLKRPVSWLPPGIAGLLLLGLMVLAARPRLVGVVLPAITLLTTLGFVVRILKKA